MADKNYTRISSMQRYQISAMLKAKVAKKVIADTIGVHISSIYRELKRNSSSKGKYNPRLAQV
ncbi:helix-turn-helix domain-containing protein, partial [Bergeyella porcorum]|uniref:helix-turn-helix domain-containing protein n=1 Tax=Bergeyella porcorum TaxID=1735111 RepID=UPI0035E8942C